MATAIEPLENRLFLSTASWLGGTGNWNNPAMWSDGAVPAYGDTVDINVAGSVVNVTDNERSDNITTTAGTTLNIEAGGDLLLDNGGTITGALTVAAQGVLEQDGAATAPIVLAGTTTMDGVFTQGYFTNTGTLNLNGASFAGGSTLTNNGTVNITGGLGFGPNLNLINSATDEVNILDDTGFTGNGTITNSGTLDLNGGPGTANLNSIEINDLGGTISVQSGTLAIEQSSYFNNAAFTISSGAAFAFDPISPTNNGDNFYFIGTSTGTGAGNLLFNGGDAQQGTPNSPAAAAIINFPSGMAQITGTAFTDSNWGYITNEGFLNYVGSSQHGLLGLENQGTIDVTGTGDLAVNRGGAFDNAATGMLNFEADASVTNPGAGSLFTNQGLIEKTAGTGVSSIGNYIDTGGTIDAQTGTIDFPGGGVFQGTIFNASTGVSISFDDPDPNGNTDYQFAGTITGSGGGHVLFASDNAATGGDATTAAIFNFPTGFAQVSGTGFLISNYGFDFYYIINEGFLNYVGSSQHGLLGLENQGTIDVTGTGDLAVNRGGAFDNAATGVLNFETDAGVTNAGGNTAFTSEGLIEKTGGTGTTVIGISGGIGLKITGGGFNVETGTISLQNGLDGFSYAAGPITVATGATLDIDAANGNIFGTGTFTSAGGGHVTYSGGNWLVANGSAPSTFNFSPGVFIVEGGQFGDNVNDINVGAITYLGGGVIGGLPNQGIVIVADSSTYADNLVLINATTGVLDFEGDATYADGYHGGVTNDGTILKSGGSGILDFSGLSLDNAGTIEAAAGTINLPNSLFGNYNAGIVGTGQTFKVDAGASITIQGQSGLYTNNGTVILNGAGASFATLDSLSTNNGTLEVLNGASLAITGSLASTGKISVGGALTINGNLTESQGTGSAPTLNFSVSALPGTPGAPDLSVTGSTTLAGNLTAEFSNGFGSNGDAYTVGNFATASSGSFSSTAGVAPAFSVLLNPTSIILNGANLPPVSAQPDTYFVQGNSFITVPAATGVLANDTDPNHLPLNAVLLTSPADG